MIRLQWHSPDVPFDQSHTENSWLEWQSHTVTHFARPEGVTVNGLACTWLWVGWISIVACLIGESEKNVNERERERERDSWFGEGRHSRPPATAIQFISPTRKEIGDMTPSIDRFIGRETFQGVWVGLLPFFYTPVLPIWSFHMGRYLYEVCTNSWLFYSFPSSTFHPTYQ